jgi:rfaE bifunctional protein nucleotidyltransferase chain/domain
MDKLAVIQSKILTREALLPKVRIWKFQGQKIVFTNGCFDIVHLGHIDYLAKAASLGNRLIVGLNTDASVSCIKGPFRPVQDEHSRAMLMAALHFVDAVVLFGEDTPLELISYLEPDVLVKGSDYSVEQIVGADVVLANGGSVQTIDFVEGYSTSKVIDKIIRSSK